MEKEKLLHLVREQRGYTFGGREVLRVTYDMPRGTCRAALHFGEMQSLWLSFVERELFPAAAREWEAAARAGRGFAFLPHAARGEILIYPHKRGVKISFSAVLSVGDEVRLSRTLSTLWNAAGERQRRRGARMSKAAF
jgi:hypothetical protein